MKTLLVKAMKENNLAGKEILRFIKGEISRVEAGRKTLTDADIVRLITKTAENLEFATDDLSKLQLKYLQDNGFIPKKLTKGDIERIVASMVTQLNVELRGMKSMGKIMKDFNDMHPGQDGKMVSSIVRETLMASA